jgi:hypothetical protein
MFFAPWLKKTVLIIITIVCVNGRVFTLARVGWFTLMPLLNTPDTTILNIFLMSSDNTLSTLFFLFLYFNISPSTVISLHADTRSHSSLPSTYPNHLNLLWRSLSSTHGIMQPLSKFFTCFPVFLRYSTHSPDHHLLQDAAYPPSSESMSHCHTLLHTGRVNFFFTFKDSCCQNWSQFSKFGPCIQLIALDASSALPPDELVSDGNCRCTGRLIEMHSIDSHKKLE